MGVTAKEFEKMVIEAKKAEIEHSQGVRVKNDVDWEELDEDFALKSMVHGNPAALEEAKAVMQWIRQKYNIK